MEPVLDNANIVLHDSFAQPESDHEEISVLIDSPRARRVVMYTWIFHPHPSGAHASRATRTQAVLCA